jgi:single-strand DNA-binding protein
MSFNKIIIVGHLGKDPELRYTPQGIAVCNFSMATTEKKRDKAGEMQDITTWFRVTLWRQQAENASKYLTKGRLVYIEGRLQVEEWTDRDGNNRHTLEVQGSEMQFLGSGGGRSEDYSGESSSNDTQFAGPTDAPASEFAPPAKGDEDIPF